MKIFSDIALSRKIERTEALSNADFVETRAKFFPESGSEWIDVAGAYAMFDGSTSPTTQTFGLGLFDPITNVEMDRIEAFFRERKSPVNNEMSPLAEPSVFNLLNERNYRPIELSTVLYLPLDSEFQISLRSNPQVTTRIISDDEVGAFAKTSMAGWIGDMPELSGFGIDLCEVGARCKGASPFLAELDGKLIATASLYIYDDVALFAGASTIPGERNKGAQTSLINARLKHAAERGCRIAIMGASPGSQSQVNAEKNGFRIAYTRTKWQLKWDQ